MLRVLKTIGMLACLVLLPTLAFAQASITGVVKDSSGAVLPGVTVEAASPVLIEKTRSAVTDGSGQYRIVDLRPGTYSVTFSLPGFSTVKREGIELTGSFIAIDQRGHEGRRRRRDDHGERRNADRRRPERQAPDHAQQRNPDDGADGAVVGGHRRADSRASSIQAGTSADIQVTPQMTVFGGAGGRANEGRMQVDGLNTGAALNGGGVSTYVADISNAPEVVTTTSGGLGEAEVGGPTLSIVPKSGGNTVKGAVYLSGVSSGMVGSNYNDALKAAGLSTPGQAAPAVGLHGRRRRADHQGSALVLRHAARRRAAPLDSRHLPEPERRRSDEVHLRAGHDEAGAGRRELPARQHPPDGADHAAQQVQLPLGPAVAVQRRVVHRRAATRCRAQDDSGAFVGSLGLGGLTATTSPETAGYLHTLVKNRQFTWSSPVDEPAAPRSRPRHVSRGVGTVRSAGQPDARPRAHHRARRAQRRQSPDCQYRSANWAHDWDNPNTWRASASYVTGGHTFKARLHRRLPGRGHPELRQRSEPGLHVQLNGRPSSLTREPAGLHAERPRPLRRALRAGSVDDGQDDAAGRAAVRPRVELSRRNRPSVRRTSCRRRTLLTSRGPTASTTRTSRRAAAWPATSSATARRR